MVQKHKIKSKVHIDKVKSLDELKERLLMLKGAYIRDLVEILDLKAPKSSLHAKGFVGQIIEYILGADFNNLSMPDFSLFDLELKTMSVDENLMPKESTFLCHAQLINPEIDFFKSSLYKKLKFILFVFVKTSKDLDLLDRQIVGFYFYKPTKDELEIFKQDYMDLNELIILGKANFITAKNGSLIQMRPKCSNGKDLTKYYNEEGIISYTRPRGFYLRRSFTKEICKKALSIATNNQSDKN